MEATAEASWLAEVAAAEALVLVAVTTAEGSVELTAVASTMAEVGVESAAEVRVVEVVRGEGRPVGHPSGVLRHQVRLGQRRGGP